MAWLLLLLAGLASLPFWPGEWRLGLAAGWVLALLVSGVAARRRQRLLDGVAGPTSVPRLVAGAFLVRLALLLLGGISGAALRLYPPAAFLLAFLAAHILGEVLAWVRHLRR